jgi:hypothetical protein
MNRRMPNGTYGGVRGWGREAPANSIGVDNNQMLNSGKEGENQDFSLLYCSSRLNRFGNVDILQMRV